MPTAVGWDTGVIDVYEGLGCTEELTKRFIHVALDAISLFDRKQHAYRCKNIARRGDAGILDRVWEKLERIENLYKLGEDSDEETIEDTWIDVGVFALMVLMCRRGWWPGFTPKKGK